MARRVYDEQELRRECKEIKRRERFLRKIEPIRCDFCGEDEQECECNRLPLQADDENLSQ